MHVAVLAMGGIPVVKVSSINSCLDSSDDTINVTIVDPHDGTSRIDIVQRGPVPFVLVRRWSEVTTALLEAHWKAFVDSARSSDNGDDSHTPSPLSGWDYSRITMHHWQQRIMGRDFAANVTSLEKMLY